MTDGLFKRCFKCWQVKPTDDFYSHPNMTDGHLNKCKDCARADVRARRLEQVERWRAYDRERANVPHRVLMRLEYTKSLAGKAAHGRASSRYQVSNPEKRRAHIIVGNAIRAGRLVRGRCEVCGGRGQAHHDDYSRPLEVRWLCPKDHKLVHQVADGGVSE